MSNPTPRRPARPALCAARAFLTAGALAATFATSLLLCAGSAQADELCTLKLKDGRVITGILVMKSDTGVTLRPEGGENTAFATAEISDIQLSKSPREEYAEKRAALKDDDLSGRFTLLRQFYYANLKSASAKVFAKAEADQLAKDFPDSESIKTLDRVMNQADEAASQKGDIAPPEAASDGTEAPASTTAPAAKIPPALPLSEDGQNLLRLYQLDFRINDKGFISGPDAKATVAISKEVVDELFKSNGDADELSEFKQTNGTAKFRSLPPLAQLNIVFALRARALYPKIKIKTEPFSLQVFRTKIHPLLTPAMVRFLAPKVPGLIANPRGATSQADAYTNFLALSLASAEGHPFIDRDVPEDSLLLQWGLPRALAKYGAPETIKDWKPCFTDKGDTRFLEISQWIKTLEALPQITAEQLPLPVPGSDKPKTEVKRPDSPTVRTPPRVAPRQP